MTVNAFFLAFLDLIGDYVHWVVLAIARPFGFTMLFAAFAWGNISSGVIRMAFSIAIALPLLANGIPSYGVEELQMAFAATLIKELFLGAVLGLISSIPLAIAIAGGSILDLYRGALEGGPDPSGVTTSPYGNLFAIVSLWLFASIGGFQIVTDTIYSSYELWPVNSTFPVFNAGATVLLEVLEKILLGALVLAGPMLVIMFCSDIVHLIASKFGKNIDVGHLTFSTKNLIAAIVLPLFLVVAIRLFKSELEFLRTVLGFVSGIFI
ncbi:MAG: flagellar biosynthetic protein FliR [Pseudomonadota bacterium]